MGLVDRLKAYQQEQANRQAANADAARRVNVERQIQEVTRQEQQVLEAQARKTAFINKFSPLLQVIEARKQLEEVREVWEVGTIDSQPTLVGDSSYTAANYLVLGISHSFPALHRDTRLIETGTEAGNESVPNNSRGTGHLELFIAVGNAHPPLYIARSYQVTKGDQNPYSYKGGFPIPYDFLRYNDRSNLTYNEVFSDADNGKKITEDWLLQILTDSSRHPLNLKRTEAENLEREFPTPSKKSGFWRFLS